MPPKRRIIIDATFPWRIAHELAARGYRDATSPHDLGDANMKDPPLLRLIHADLEPAVLVTYDHKMAVEHRRNDGLIWPHCDGLIWGASLV